MKPATVDSTPLGYPLPPDAADGPHGHRRWGLYFPTTPIADTFYEAATVAFILCFLFFSFLSLSFILLLHLKSRNCHHLRSFSAHSTARFLMIILISLWSINEFLRLPVFRKRFILPFLPFTAIPYQTHFCKFHLILSFGLYEPGFLVSLLFLVNLSIKKRNPNDLWAIGFVLITCLPLIVALYFTVYILPGKIQRLPRVFFQSSVLLEEKFSWAQLVSCTYPLLGNVIFTIFGVGYALVFSLSCCRVMDIAINKRLRSRVNTLAYTVIVCLTVQMVMLTGSLFWEPESVQFYMAVLVNFMCVLSCGVVGETVMVIKPISDALRVGREDRSNVLV